MTNSIKNDGINIKINQPLQEESEIKKDSESIRDERENLKEKSSKLGSFVQRIKQKISNFSAQRKHEKILISVTKKVFSSDNISKIQTRSIPPKIVNLILEKSKRHTKDIITENKMKTDQDFDKGCQKLYDSIKTANLILNDTLNYFESNSPKSNTKDYVKTLKSNINDYFSLIKNPDSNQFGYKNLIRQINNPAMKNIVHAPESPENTPATQEYSDKMLLPIDKILALEGFLRKNIESDRTATTEKPTTGFSDEIRSAAERMEERSNIKREAGEFGSNKDRVALSKGMRNVEQNIYKLGLLPEGAEAEGVDGNEDKENFAEDLGYVKSIVNKLGSIKEEEPQVIRTKPPLAPKPALAKKTNKKVNPDKLAKSFSNELQAAVAKRAQKLGIEKEQKITGGKLKSSPKPKSTPVKKPLTKDDIYKMPLGFADELKAATAKRLEKSGTIEEPTIKISEAKPRPVTVQKPIITQKPAQTPLGFADELKAAVAKRKNNLDEE